MAADFVFSESNGVGEVVSDDIANINFGSVDASALVPATYPITRGNNSFTKYLRGKFTGSFTEISNILFWKSAGAYKTEENIDAEANAIYATPTAVDMAGTTIPITSGTALAIESFEGAATIVSGGSGVSGYTGYIKMQTQTTSNTESGAVNSKTLTMQYDET